MFDMYDLDRSGSLGREEFKTMMRYVLQLLLSISFINWFSGLNKKNQSLEVFRNEICKLIIPSQTVIGKIFAEPLEKGV